MTTAPREKKGGWLREEFGNPERRTAYYMVLPTLVIILAVAFYPIIYSIWLSLHNATLNNLGEFVGIQNYTQMFQNGDFQVALVNSTFFTVISVTIEFALGLAIALAINRAFRGRGLVRAAVLVPWAFPTAISAAMWRLMFQDQVGIIQYAGRYQRADTQRQNFTLDSRDSRGCLEDDAVYGAFDTGGSANHSR